jgi:RNA polymerase sigma factor (sigma-70 family)
VGELQAEDTSATLLAKLRVQPNDPAVWQDFVGRYRPSLYKFCLGCGLQPADAEDVTQAVLLKLVQHLPQFQYDPGQRFRGWLQTVARRILCDYCEEKRRALGSGNPHVLHLLDQVEAREGLVQQLEAEFDRELLDLACRRVRARAPARQWEAFRLTVLEGRSGAEAAAELKMLVATVYTSRSKVQKLVSAEILRLEERAEA